jgi:hypothetical protein
LGAAGTENLCRQFQVVVRKLPVDLVFDPADGRLKNDIATRAEVNDSNHRFQVRDAGAISVRAAELHDQTPGKEPGRNDPSGYRLGFRKVFPADAGMSLESVELWCCRQEKLNDRQGLQFRPKTWASRDGLAGVEIAHSPTSIIRQTGEGDDTGQLGMRNRWPEL